MRSLSERRGVPVGFRARVLVAMLGLALVAGACSGSDPVADALPTTAPTESTALVVQSGDDSSSALGVDTEAEPGSLDELEQQWERARSAVVAELSDESFGRDGALVLGPGDLAVDLSQCPSEWIDGSPASEPLTVAALGDSESFGRLIDGLRAYVDHVNDEGGINGQPIRLVSADDQRTPTKTIEAVEDLIESSPPLAVTTFGTLSSQAVFDELNRQCLPQPFVGSAHPAWGDPQNHPWTTGFQVAYSTEVILWGGWIRRNLADDLPVTVAALTAESDFGRAYLAAISDWSTRNRDVVAEVVPVTHDPSGSGLVDSIAQLTGSEANVAMVLTAGDPCSTSLETLANSEIDEQLVATFIPSTCADPARYLVPVGRDADGAISMASPMKAANDPLYTEDPFVSHINSILAAAGIDDPSGQAAIGAGQYGWAYVEALRIAAELDGGISRSNLLLAIRSLKLRHPMLLGGISFSVDGANDAFYIEGGRMQRYAAGTTSWEPETLVIDLDGATPNCAWDGESC